MPRVFSRTSSIRHYECGADGKVSDAYYLRFMQEAAYSASADAGYDMVGYRSMGRLWFIRETHVTFLQPLHYGDRVTVRTWVKDFHRVRSIRAYELVNEATAETAARAWSDWIFMDSGTGMPRSIPDEMIAAFLPDARERVVEPRKRFPTVARPMNGVYRHARRVEWRDLDGVGHVNNAVYLAYIQECGMEADQAAGWERDRLTQLKIQPVCGELHIEYKQSAIYPDSLEISTWITFIDENTYHRFFTIIRKNDGELISQAVLQYRWTHLDTGIALPTPVEWLRYFRDDTREGLHG